MKQKVNFFLAIMLCILSLYSCSKDDGIELSDENQEIISPEPTIEELLVENSPWDFTNYEVLEIVSTTNPSITNNDINNHVSNLLQGFSLTFNADGTVIINHPLSDEIVRTWVLFNNDIIFDSESNTPQIWQNIQVSNEDLSIENTLFTIFESSFDSVEHYGKLNFE